jgi:hypothetical protein
MRIITREKRSVFGIIFLFLGIGVLRGISGKLVKFKRTSKKSKIEVTIIALVFFGTTFAVPMSLADDMNTNDLSDRSYSSPVLIEQKVWLDRSYLNENEQDLSVADGQNDMGYHIDAKDRVQSSLELYVAEPIDQTIPGRGRQGTLDPADEDKDDWYKYSVCNGQTIMVSITTTSSFGVEITDIQGDTHGTSFTTPVTGMYFVHVFANTNATAGTYTLSVTITGQNDAGKAADAGNTIATATAITPGISYDGYMTYLDTEDWYSFSANSGQGIFVDLEALDKKEGDFDVYLYNPSGELKHSAMYYGNDSLEFPADATGIWKIKIAQWPGWDTTKWPDNYFLYGSGVYKFKVNVGGTAQPPVGPVPQTEIIPIAQTFKIANNPDGSNDEYAFLAAVPAAVYKEGGKQYVSPIVYTGDTTTTSWFGIGDDTTQYLLDDWSEYLSHFGFKATVYTVDTDPVTSAANIALNGWSTTDTAVLAVDGSEFKDTTSIMDLDQDATLKVTTDKTVATAADLKTFAGKQALQMWVGKEWGSMTIYVYGSSVSGVGLVNMRYESSTWEDWPHPYDNAGNNTNIYFPIEVPGFHWPFADSNNGLDTFEVTLYSGDRYKLNVDNTDSSIYVSVTTDEPSYLEVFLIDPEGLARRPMPGSWNGGPINPIHIWNGDHHNGYEAWRRWEPTYSTEHTVELNYPEEGKWTVIVTPHYPYGQEKTTDSIPYHITAEIREHNQDRVNAGLSAANGAVIASQIHAPLLYVTANSVPTETQNALAQLGVKDIVFVNLGDISSAIPSGSVTELNTEQELITMVKSSKRDIQASVATSDPVITITSFGTEDGYFAPAGLIAAYHGSNLLNIGEIPDVFNTVDKVTMYREYSGAWYHGMRAQGHLAKMTTPEPSLIKIIKAFLSGSPPPLGFDMDYRWGTAVHDGIYNWVTEKGLTEDGQECYLFVSPRDSDIRHPILEGLYGLGSYAGQFPFDTPGMDAALISRDILYPAIIYANPGRDVTTSQLMNFPDSWTWTTNDGAKNRVNSPNEIKESLSSHGRFFEGHCLWEGLLARINEGASVNFYSGHGTGGQGISAQYSNVAETFPEVELTHPDLYDFDWWDGWRGYMYDDEQTKDPRWGGMSWYNAKEPNLYDIIHFKWVDQLLQNLHSEIELWLSTSTGQHFGPEIYLEHGSALWYGDAGTGGMPAEDLLDLMCIKDFMVNGSSIGQALSKYIWLYERDFTAKNVDMDKYNIALYGSSTMQISSLLVIYGDPTLTCYSPEWTEPIPVLP